MAHVTPDGRIVGDPGDAGYKPGTNDPQAAGHNALDQGDAYYSAHPELYTWTTDESSPSGGRWMHVGDTATTAESIGGNIMGGPVAVPTGAPGTTLDVTASNEDRDRIAALLSQLGAQAQTGEGAWQAALGKSTQDAANAAKALGQSIPSAGYARQAQAMASGVGAAEQRGVAEGNLLRAQQQQAAAQQLVGLTGAQADLEASQAQSEAAARQAKREADLQLTQQAGTQNQGVMGALTSAIMFGAKLLGADGKSKGGEVPGKPKVFGDDEANDTVPAWLSPGEIVIPRTIANAPDAAEKAASFVDALKARHGHGHHFDAGGKVPYDPTATGSVNLGSWLMPLHFNAEAPSVANGSLLPTAQYDAARQAALNAAQAYQGQTASVAPQLTQNALDAGVLGAMQAGARARGASAGLSPAMVEQIAKGGGQAAQAAQGEETAGSRAFGQALLAQRQRDLNFARAQQQAAWRNTQMNLGLGAQQQSAIAGILGSAGQAGSTLSSMLSEQGKSSGPSPESQRAIDAAFNAEPSAAADGSSALGDWEQNIEAGSTAARGGMVDDRARRFLAALGAR